MLDTHVVVLDGQGRIIPWTPNPADGYDRVMFLSWDLLKNRIPLLSSTGLPVFYTESEYHPATLTGTGWPNNPAGKNAMLADSAAKYYAYSGDPAVIGLVRGLLDHQLQYGTTPSSYAWGGVPWSSAAAGSLTYGNDTLREGAGVLEPDKLGELGYFGYLTFYKLTGDARYLNAAIACADTLARHVRDGTATTSPWAFRVVAQTGATAQREEYCADVVGPIRLFDELIRLGLGNTAAYQAARQKAWTWLMTYPMANNVWSNYFEDDPPLPNSLQNLNQYNPGETARYLLEHPEFDPDWQRHVAGLLAYIETTFGGTDSGEAGQQYGATVISEQIIYKFKMASHTSRLAANHAALFARTGDAAAREKAYRSLNWCTYMCRDNGVVIEGPAEFTNNPACWFTDGHGDYVRHFMIALGAVPEWAPAGQNHLTGSTSTITSVTYGAGGDEIAYTTYDRASTETLRVRFAPASVRVDGVASPQRADLLQPGWTYAADTGVLRIRHDNGAGVVILGQVVGPGNQPPVILLTSPVNGGAFVAPAAIPLGANASDVDGSIESVDFYSGSILIGSATSAPYTAVWSGVGPGTYTVSAVAADNLGATTISQPAVVTVTGGARNIGNSSEGSLVDTIWDGGAWINAARFPATFTLTATTMSAKVAAISGRYKCAIYADNGGQPGRLLATTSEVTNPGTGWQTFPLAASLTLAAGSNYWLAIWSDASGARVFHSGSGGTLRWARANYGAWPNPVTTTGGNSYNYCIYASGSSAPAPTLASITVTPTNPTVVAPATQAFTATGNYSDASTQNITSQVAWTSSVPARATISSGGLATGVSAGTTTISASLAGVSGSTTLTVQVSAPSIVTSSLGGGIVGVPYSATLSATGGTPPYAWSVISGSLPAGLTLGASTGAISGTPTAAERAGFSVLAADAGNPAQTALKTLAITVAAPPTGVSIWPATAVPRTADSGADSSVELGVKFRADVAGTIRGIRFYKASANTGTHVGNLWSTTGSLLATATFTGEGAAGWQQVNFATPVPVAANTVYVASYHCNNGHYSADTDFFATAGIDRPPLHALRNGTSGGNGVFRYGTGNRFPNQTWRSANYWVDVLFVPAAP